MVNLFFSFIFAISGALGLVALSKTFNVDVQTSNIFPLIPIFYAIAYKFLDEKWGAKSKPVKQDKSKDAVKPGVQKITLELTASRILMAVGISFSIKILLDIFYTSVYVYASGQSFAHYYGSFNVKTIGIFLKGEHPWLSSQEGIHILSIIAFISSLGTGLWIGYTSKGKAILEGVLAGAIVTLITTMTNMLVLYQRIEDVANQTAASFGYATPVGLATVITFQVLLYGLWSGIVQKSKERQANSKPSKR